jgi:hypothetical protein
MNDQYKSATWAAELITRDLTRFSLPELIYWLQDMQLRVNNGGYVWRKQDEGVFGYQDGPVGRFCTALVIKALRSELERRCSNNLLSSSLPEQSIIAAIKQRANIVEVLEQFTQVFVHGGKWTYRCTLHGEDKNPSGAIYQDTQTAHCFACNQGGDALDIVKLFNHTDTRGAIQYLSKFYNIGTALKAEKKEILNSLNSAILEVDCQSTENLYSDLFSTYVKENERA